jgi:hypothetical protein
MDLNQLIQMLTSQGGMSGASRGLTAAGPLSGSMPGLLSQGGPGALMSLFAPSLAGNARHPETMLPGLLGGNSFGSAGSLMGLK